MTAFCEDEVAQSRSHPNDLFDGIVGDEAAVGEVEDPEGFVCPVWWQPKEGCIRDEIAVSKAHFAEVTEVGEEGDDGGVGDLVTTEEVNFEEMRAVFGERKNGLVRNLVAFVQF